MSGWVLDAILAGMVLEAALLIRRGVLATLAAGFCLVLAMRLTLAGVGLPWIGAALLAALVAHVLDLRARCQ